MEEQAQSVGNAKIREEFDMEATMCVDPNTNDECLRRDLLELNPFLGRDRLCRYSLSGSHGFPLGRKKY